MERFSFALQISPDDYELYVERHKHIDPELLQAFRDAGIRTYSIYYDRGRLYAYMEAANIQAAFAGLDNHSANVKWQQFMSDILLRENGETIRPLEEVFHFDNFRRHSDRMRFST